MCNNNKTRHFHNLLFLIAILLVESFVLGIYLELTLAFDYLQKPNVINPFLALLGFGLLGTLYKFIFEGWLIYSVSTFRALKKGITQTKKELLNSRIISVKIFTATFIVGLAFVILVSLFKGEYLQILGAVLWSTAVLFVYITPVLISYYFANKYIIKYEKHT